MRLRWLSFFLVFLFVTGGCGSPDSSSTEEERSDRTSSNTAQESTTGSTSSAADATREDAWPVVDSPPDSVRRIRIERIVQAGRDLGATETEIRRRYGPPEVMQDTVEDTPYGTQIRRKTLTYPGITFRIMEVIGEEKSLNRGPIVRREGVLADTLVQMGDSRLDVRKTFGTASARASATDSTSEIEYETMGLGATDYVVFRFTNEQLTEIEWDLYVE